MADPHRPPRHRPRHETPPPGPTSVSRITRPPQTSRNGSARRETRLHDAARPSKETIPEDHGAADRTQTDPARPPPAPPCRRKRYQRPLRKLNDTLPQLGTIASPHLQPAGPRLTRLDQTCRHVRAAADCRYPTASQSAAPLARNALPSQLKSGCRLARYPRAGALNAHGKPLLTMSGLKIRPVLHG